MKPSAHIDERQKNLLAHTLSYKSADESVASREGEMAVHKSLCEYLNRLLVETKPQHFAMLAKLFKFECLKAYFTRVKHRTYNREKKRIRRLKQHEAQLILIVKLAMKHFAAQRQVQKSYNNTCLCVTHTLEDCYCAKPDASIKNKR